MLVKKGFGSQISLTRFRSPSKQMNKLNKICLFKIVFHSVFHSKDTISWYSYCLTPVSNCRKDTVGVFERTDMFLPFTERTSRSSHSLM